MGQSEICKLLTARCSAFGGDGGGTTSVLPSRAAAVTGWAPWRSVRVGARGLSVHNCEVMNAKEGEGCEHKRGQHTQ